MAIATRDLPGGMVLLYAVHDHVAPTPEEWRDYVDAARGVVRRVGADRAAGLAVTDGGSPDAQQRQQVITMIREEDGGRVDRIRSAVISESLIVRTVVGAFTLLLTDISLFAPAGAWDALDFVRVPRSDAALVRADLEGLAARVPGVVALRSMLDVLR